MEPLLLHHFIRLDAWMALQVVALGVMGGILAGSTGSGGAFFTMPGMMSLGVPGAVAVASEMTRGFGEAAVALRGRRGSATLDRRLTVFFMVASLIGLCVAVGINDALSARGGGGPSAGPSPAADLYVSVVFVCTLCAVAISMLRDPLRPGSVESDEPGLLRRVARRLADARLSPYVALRVSGVRVSLWLVAAAGLATGYLAGTIGTVGIVAVPCMVGLLGIPTAVAEGSTLYLAVFIGAWGALDYAFHGLVDLRLTLLLYVGSLVGVRLGAYGAAVVKAGVIRTVGGVVILLCAASRAAAVPVLLRRLGWVDLDPGWDRICARAGESVLLAGGVAGCSLVLCHVVRSYRKRMRVRDRLAQPRAAT